MISTGVFLITSHQRPNIVIKVPHNSYTSDALLTCLISVQDVLSGSSTNSVEGSQSSAALPSRCHTIHHIHLIPLLTCLISVQDVLPGSTNSVQGSQSSAAATTSPGLIVSAVVGSLAGILLLYEY